MASERAPSPIQVAQDAPPRDDAHPEPAPQPVSPSQEGDPFKSREGSPRQHTTGNIPPSSTNPHVHASVDEKSADGDSLIGVQDRNNFDRGLGANPQFPSSVRYSGEVRPGNRRRQTTDTRMSQQPRSFMDHLVNVPSIEKRAPSVEVRLADTIAEAEKRQSEYAFRAKWTGYVLNIAIGLQVLLGSLTTGLSAAATSGKSAAVQTTILGALATLVASYLARARGSGEPELSNERVKNLDQFIRETKAFVLDHSDGRYDSDPKIDAEVINIRHRLEVLLGNTTKGEIKSSQSAA